MAELNQNVNSKQPRCCVNFFFFYFANKRVAHLTQLFTSILQNRCPKRIRKFQRKLSILGSFLQCSAHIFWDMMAAYEKLI